MQETSPSEREEVDEWIDSYYEYLGDLKHKIASSQDKLTREISKREGFYEEYCFERERDWDNYNFNVGLYMN